MPQNQKTVIRKELIIRFLRVNLDGSQGSGISNMLYRVCSRLSS